MRRVAYLVGIVVLVSSGMYVFVYLARWEWNRALMAAAFFLVAEVALLGAVIIERLRSLSAQISDLRDRTPDTRTRERLRESAPQPSNPFAWLSPKRDEMGVFVPILMGAGVLLSAVAWLIERIARGTAQPVLERGLAVRLRALAMPDALVDPTGNGVFDPGRLRR